jgi:predicted nuclease of restriction endonuclease-like (RecB) superfamily
LNYFHFKYLEKDVEEAILRELENFILEPGKGFAFVERQKRMNLNRTSEASEGSPLDYRQRRFLS